MKQSSHILHLAVALFAGSMALHALGDIRGYFCAYVCLVTVVNLDTLRNESGIWAYYTGFALANFAFVWVYFMLLVRHRITKFARIVILISTLQVFSWFILNLRSWEDLSLGYYVWAASFALLAFVANKRKPEPNKAMEPTPVAVTISAAQKVVPSTSVAHLGR